MKKYDTSVFSTDWEIKECQIAKFFRKSQKKIHKLMTKVIYRQDFLLDAWDIKHVFYTSDNGKTAHYYSLTDDQALVILALIDLEKKTRKGFQIFAKYLEEKREKRDLNYVYD